MSVAVGITNMQEKKIYKASGESEMGGGVGFSHTQDNFEEKFSPDNSPSVVKVNKLHPFESSTTPSNCMYEMPVGSMCTCASDNSVNSASLAPSAIHRISTFLQNKMSFGRKLVSSLCYSRASLF